LADSPPFPTQQNNDSSLSNSQILGLIETIIVYKFPVLEREVIAKMLGIDVLKETRVYKDALQEGRQEGQSNLILKLLVRKLGELPEETAAKIYQMSDQQLDALSDRFFDITTQADLKTCIAELPKPEKPKTSLAKDEPNNDSNHSIN